MGDRVGDFMRIEKDSLFFEVFKDEGATFFGCEVGIAVATDGEHMTVVGDDAEVF